MRYLLDTNIIILECKNDQATVQLLIELALQISVHRLTPSLTSCRTKRLTRPTVIYRKELLRDAG
jgi:predicted nucleic acid-binding protein